MKAQSGDGDGNNGAWYGYEGLSSLIQIYAPNVQTLVPATTLGGLGIQLNNIAKDGQYFIPLNINCLSQNFEDGKYNLKNNHWAGIYVVRSFDQIIKIIYIDPMGKALHPALASTITGTLGISEIGQPLLNRPVQFVELDSTGSFIERGNDADCGPLLVYCVASIVHGKSIRHDIKTPEQSISLGQYLREAFNKQVSFEEIHGTIFGQHVNINKNAASSILSIEAAEVQVKEIVGKKKVFQEKIKLFYEEYQSNDNWIKEEYNKELFKLVHEQYQLGSEFLRVQYRELLAKEVVYNFAKNKAELARIFTDIANSNIELAQEAIPELKLQYYNDAASACHYVLQLVKDKDGQAFKHLEQGAYSMLDSIHKCIIEICGGDASEVSAIVSQNDIDAVCHRSEIKALRDETKKSLNQVERYREARQNELYINGSANLFKTIALGMGQYLAELYKEAEGIIGSPPCSYAVIGLGSMALRQMTPWSDLEFAILTKNEDYKQSQDLKVRDYFRNLTQLVHFKIINLGETPISLSKYHINLDSFVPVAVNFDLGGKVPLGRIERDKPYELIQTVERMLKYLENEEGKTEHIDKNLAAILQKVCLVRGDESLVKSYQNQAQEFLLLLNENGRSNGEVRAIRALWEGVEEIDYTKPLQSLKKIEGNLTQFSFSLHESEGKLFDVKQEIYRLPDRLIYNLGLIYGIQEESSWNTLDRLCELSKISAEGANNLKKALTFATNLRLKTYGHYSYQKETMDYDKSYDKSQNDAEEVKVKLTELYRLSNEDLEPDGSLFEYYKIALPLHTKLREFCRINKINQREGFFDKELFYRDDAGTKAQIHLRLLQYEAAQENYFVELEVLKAKYGEEHIDVATSLHNIGGTYGKLGMHELALKYGLEALELRKKLLGEEHPSTAAGLANVGSTYFYLGKYDLALKYQSEALAFYKKLDYSYTISILNNMSLAYGELGKHRLALKHHLEALELRKKLLGEEHLSVATSLDSVGLAYLQFGKYKLALKYCLEAWTLRKKLLGEEHPSVAKSLNNVGSTYGKLGMHELALKYGLEALELRKKLLGEEHPSVATSLNNVGGTYGKLGMHELALKYRLEALEMFKKLLGEEHLSTAASLTNVGSTYGKLGMHELALKYGLEALELCKKLLGEEHPHVSGILSSLGTTYTKLGKYELALKYLTEELELSKKLLGEEHLSTATSLNNVGFTYGELGQYELALAYHFKALELRKKLLGEEHLKVAWSLNNIGRIYVLSKQYEVGLEYVKKSLELRTKSVELENIDIAANFVNMGIAYGKLGKFVQALEYFQKALNIREKHLEAKHSAIAECKQYIAWNYGKIKQYDQAIIELEVALSIFKNNHHQVNITKCEKLKQKILSSQNGSNSDSSNKLPDLPGTIKIVSYNITADYFDKNDKTEDKYHHWQYRAPLVKKLLELVAPDIVCLQELSPNQALELHEYLAGKYSYSSIFLSQTPSEIGAGLIVSGAEIKSWCGKRAGTPLIGTFISKFYEFINSGRFWLNENPDTVPEEVDRGTSDKGFGNMNTYRAVLWAKVQVNEKVLFVFNSHYPLSGNNKTRHECAKLEMAKIKEITQGNNDWVSAGDRNIIPAKDDNEIYNPKAVKQELAKDANDISDCSNHYGINTTWLGFSYDEHQNQIKDGVFQDCSVIDVIVSNLMPVDSFYLHGAFNPETRELLPLFGQLTDEQNQSRYFASDHALIGADLYWD